MALKSERLLLAGNVSVFAVNGRRVQAVVRGDSGYHEVEHRSGQWSCSCPALRSCSHVLAVRRVCPIAGEVLVVPDAPERERWTGVA